MSPNTVNMNKILRNLLAIFGGLFVSLGMSAQTCTISMIATDSFGDGWNGGEVTVYVNGVATLTWGGVAPGQTLTGGFAFGPAGKSITVNAGDVIDFTYTDDSFDGENDLIIVDCLGGTIFADNMGNYDSNAGTEQDLLTGYVAPDGGVAAPLTCTYTVTKTDMFGDNWNGAELQIVNATTGAPACNLAHLGGESSSCDIVLNDGETYDFFFTGGGFPTEVGIIITDPAGNEILNISEGSFGTETQGVYTNIFSLTPDCPQPCGLICPVTGSGSFVDQYFLQAGECDVQVTVPVTVVGLCDVKGQAEGGLGEDLACSLFLAAGADPANCPDNNDSVDVATGTVTLQASDPADFGGGGANSCLFCGHAVQVTLPGDGEICFDWEVTDPGSLDNFSTSIGTDWSSTVVSTGNLGALTTLLADSDNPGGPGATTTCVSGAAGDVVAVVVWSDYFNNGSTFGAGALTAVVNNFVYTPSFTVPEGLFNYQTILPIGEDQTVAVEFCLADGMNTIVSCPVEIDVFGYTGPTATALACNDDVNISVDENCEVLIGADIFLEGGPYDCYDTYCVYIRPFGGDDRLDLEGVENVNGLPLGLPAGQHIYEVQDCDGNQNLCWGYFTIEDKFPPSIQCDCPVGGTTEFTELAGELSADDPAINFHADIGGCGIPPSNSFFANPGDAFYDEYAFTVQCDADYTVAVTSSWGDGEAFIYSAPINPNDVCENLVAWDGDGPTSFDPVVNLTATTGTVYYLYVSSWAPGTTGTYTVEVTSDDKSCGANLLEGFTPEECLFSCLDENNWGVIDVLPTPTVIDNCGAGELAMTEVWVDGENCGERILYRNWTLTDPNSVHNNNPVTCTQEFVFEAITVGDLVLPTDLVELPGCGGEPTPEDLKAAFEAQKAAAMGAFRAGFDAFVAGVACYPDPEAGLNCPCLPGDDACIKAAVEAYVAANRPDVITMAIEAGFGPFYIVQVPIPGFPDCYVDDIECLVDGNVCNLFGSYDDVLIPACGVDCPGNNKIIRTWTILDWCDGSTTPYVQVIKATDNEAPEISAPDLTVSVNPWTCTANFRLPCPEHLHDNCYGDLTYSVVGPPGVTVNQIPSTLCGGYEYEVIGAPKTMFDAPHVFKYVAEDCCGNVGEYDMYVTVLDNTPPVAIAKENIVISLTSTPGQEQGVAKMYTQSVDNGSHDGDCGPVHLEIRRTLGAAACGNLGQVSSGSTNPLRPFDADDDCDEIEEVLVPLTGDGISEEIDGDLYYGTHVCYYNNNITFDNDRSPNIPSDNEIQHDDVSIVDGGQADSRYDTDGGEFVKFCCEDIDTVDASGTAYGTVTVILRVWDDGNMTGIYGDWVDLNGDGDFQDFGELDNYSDTWANVRVEDKLGPALVCPADVTLKCDQDYTDLSVTGSASASASCSGIGVEYTDESNIDVCGAGYVLRTWCVEGSATYCCTQKITIDYFSTWDPCDLNAGIIWPRDYTGEAQVQDPWCGRNPGTTGPIECRDTDTGEPSWVNSPCDLIGYSLDSDTFYFEEGACYKVLNHWSVINWCIYNPNDADWNGVGNEGVDWDGDCVNNLYDADDNGNGMTDSYYINPAVSSALDRRYYFDDLGGLYYVDVNTCQDTDGDGCIDDCSVGRDYSVDIWDLIPSTGTEPGYYGKFDPEAEDDGIADGLYTHTQVIKFIDEYAPEIEVPELCVPVSNESVKQVCSPSANLQLNCEQLIHEIRVTDPTNPTGGGISTGEDYRLKATAYDTLSDCASKWLGWQVEVDVWGDWTIDYTFSSFIPDISPNCPFDLPKTESGEEIALSIPDPIAASKYKHRVIWRVTDGCGNVVQHESYFTVEDKKAPTPYCINLSTALMENGEVELWACDFDAGAFDNCTPDSWLRYTFNGPDEGFETPESTPNYDPETRCQGKTFDCSHLAAAEDGLYPVRVYVWDECNNVDFCMVNLKLVDNQNACGGDTIDGASRIAGDIYTETGRMVDNVDVNVTEPVYEIDNHQMTADGHYVFDGNIEYMDYTISGEKNDDYLNGVSTLDLVLIQKHILNISQLDSPYKMIAADANNDQGISAIDLIELRKLILGIYTELPLNDSWRFVDAEATLNIENPWPFKEVIVVEDLVEDMMEENFVGVKIGDVNDSAELVGSTIAERSANELIINAAPVANAGGTVTMEVTADNFNEISGLQFTMELGGLELTNVEAGALNVSSDNFGLVNGKLTTSWASEAPVTTSEVLFTLTFNANDANLDNAVAINSSITAAEAYQGEELNVIDVTLAGQTTNAEFALMQNEPNPFNQRTIVGFTLPVDGQATLTVYDVTGKVITTVRGEYNQGYNEIELSKKDMNTSGVLYYQLDSGDFTATKKMIILD